MRAIWTGAITFGLVNVPVKVYSATEDHDISLHQVHDADGGRIRYQRKCEICGEVVDYSHIDKAFVDGERTVVLTDDDLKSLPEEKSREIDVVEFVPSEQIDPLLFDKSYYLEPASKSTKSYALLLQTLQKTERTAIVHFALRQKTRLGALRVHGDVLVLQALLWEDEVREASFPALDDAVTISDRELTMSEALVTSFESDFTPEKYHDDYQLQLKDLIDRKLEQGDTVDTEKASEAEGDESDGGGEVLDLMEALRRSVERSRAGADARAAAPADAAADEAEASPAASDASSPAAASAASSTDEDAPATKKKTAARRKKTA